MKRTILCTMLTLAMLLSSSVCMAGSDTSNILVDSLNDWSKIYERSDNLWRLTNNIRNFCDDESRVAKPARESGHLTYRFDTLRSAKITVYCNDVVDNSDIKLYSGAQNGEFQECRILRNEAYNGQTGYYVYELAVKDLPEDTLYFKIELLPSMKIQDSLQVGEVLLSSSENDFDFSGLVFLDELTDASKMFSIATNLKFQQSSSNSVPDVGCLMRRYPIDQSFKYYIPNMFGVKLRTFLMDGTGDIEMYISSYDGGYKKVEVKKTYPIHTGKNWSESYMTASDFPVDTNYLKIVIKSNSVATWTPMVGRVEIYY